MLSQLHCNLVRHAPKWLRGPLGMTPFGLKKQVLTHLISWQLNEALAEGELDFLSEKWLRIEVRDLGLAWAMTLKNQKIVVVPADSVVADVLFSGEANDLILIAARQQDPDTLFFQRRLWVEGDTELGLYVKNLMDAVDLDAMPTALRVGMQKLAQFVAAGQTAPATASVTAS
ncbi:MAG: ubiquinone anaerobic biosynthesis accessory factor UbiT [Neisseriaceae bacterium]